MSRVLSAVEEVLKLAVLDKGDLRIGCKYDVFCIYPKDTYTYRGEKTILTLRENRIWLDYVSFVIWDIKVDVEDMSHLHLFLPLNSQKHILRAFKGSQFSATIVKEALSHLYSGQTVEIA